MENKHTPGPWKVVVDTRYTTGLLIRDASGEGYVVAQCNYINNSNAKRVNDCVDANSRLIAAAPELLEACKQALVQFEYLNENLEATSFNGMVHTLKLAISKATGA